MNYVFEEALEAAAAVKSVAGQPTVGIILGSGLGVFARQIKAPTVVPYTRIPNFPPARVEGHAGHLIFADIGGVRVAVLSGRVHYYEGYGLDTVTLGTRTLALLGIRAMIVTNASGGIRDDLAPGDLMVIEDHINLMGANALMGHWDPRLGARYPDMSAAYDPDVRSAILAAGKETRVKLQEGVYAAVSGPSYETPAEIRMLSRIGADAVGMSTVPEVTVATQMGVRAAGISCIANRAAGLSEHKLSHQEVMEETAKASRRFCKLLTAAIPLVDRAVARKPRSGESEKLDRIEEKRNVGRHMKDVGKKKRKRKARR
ncbi:MAG: purine-nucleoside phosphorylase [Planctomycetota bacterium JB042]